jgi:Mg2+ and Co2+ transporter CorA
MYGMNVPLPQFPGGPDMQFWWLIGIVSVIVVTMLAALRRRDWL